MKALGYFAVVTGTGKQIKLLQVPDSLMPVREFLGRLT